MKNYFAFLKKELFEALHTYKLLILLIVYFVFGLMNPLAAKLTPELLQSMTPDGMSISIPEPIALDSWLQFFKNNTQLGFVLIIILFSGILASELSSGTLTILLTKGLSRISVVLAKFTAMIALWTVSYGMCAALTFGYTNFLFPNDSVINLWFAIIGVWVVGIFILSVLMFAACITNKNYSCMLIVAGTVVLLLLGNFFPAFERYNPLSLASDTTSILTGTKEINTLFLALIITICLSLALVSVGTLVFRKKQL